MRATNKCLLLGLCALLPCLLRAQDTLPRRLPATQALRRACEVPLGQRGVLFHPLAKPDSLPSTFRGVQPNRILREEALFPLFEALCEGHRPVRVVHLGDSHVRGHVFPVVAREVLEEAFGRQAVYPDTITYRTSAKARETGRPGLVYHALGVNGATAVQFTTPERLDEVAALQPDLLILSFGTNESHGKRYDPAEHTAQMDTLLHALHDRCPQAVVLLTTPPGSYVRLRRNRRVVNTLTPRVVENQLLYAERHHLPVWNLYAIAGGKGQACRNWKEGHYMQRDQVHYTHEGYRLQGTLLAGALIQAFNDYVAHD